MSRIRHGTRSEQVTDEPARSETDLIQPRVSQGNIGKTESKSHLQKPMGPGSIPVKIDDATLYLLIPLGPSHSRSREMSERRVVVSSGSGWKARSKRVERLLCCFPAPAWITGKFPVTVDSRSMSRDKCSVMAPLPEVDL